MKSFVIDRLVMENERRLAEMRRMGAREALERLRFPTWRRPETEESLQTRGVSHVRERRECIGLDLICNNCKLHIPKSQKRQILCNFYPPNGLLGSPLTRCYVRCLNCLDDIELGRNIGDADNFTVIGGATLDPFPAASENVTESDPNLKNEAYPDALLDSPNDFKDPMVETAEEEEPTNYCDYDDDGDVDSRVMDLEIRRADLQVLAEMHDY